MHIPALALPSEEEATGASFQSRKSLAPLPRLAKACPGLARNVSSCKLGEGDHAGSIRGSSSESRGRTDANV